MSSQSLIDLHVISSSYVTLGSTVSHIHNFHPTSSCQYCVYCVEVCIYSYSPVATVNCFSPCYSTATLTQQLFKNATSFFGMSMNKTITIFHYTV